MVLVRKSAGRGQGRGVLPYDTPDRPRDSSLDRYRSPRRETDLRLPRAEVTTISRPLPVKRADPQCPAACHIIHACDPALHRCIPYAGLC